MIDSPQRHRVHRDIEFIALPRDTGKAIPSAASRDGIKVFYPQGRVFLANRRLPIGQNSNLLGVLCASVVK
jgi:hypothetical protein